MENDLNQDMTPGEDPVCPEGPFNGAYGSDKECYAIASGSGSVFSIDKDTGRATFRCVLPESPVEALAAHPATGAYYYIHQGSGEFGRFFPDTCTQLPLGTGPSDTGGAAFSTLDNHMYAADENSGDFYRYSKNADGEPVEPVQHLFSITAGESLAIMPGTDFGYMCTGDQITKFHIQTGQIYETFGVNARSSVDGLTFDRFGRLFGNNNSDPYLFEINITDNPGATRDVGPFNPVICPPGTSGCPSDTTDIEALECNSGCAFEECVFM